MLFTLSVQVSAVGPAQLTAPGDAAIIMFYVDQSERCKEFAAVYEGLNTRFEKLKFNCGIHKDYCQEHDIHALPTL